MHKDVPPLEIEKESFKIYKKIASKEVTIISGRNNSGKSSLLKKLYKDLGEKSSFLGPNRYQNFDRLSVVSGKRNKVQAYISSIQQLEQSNQNIDNSPWSLQQAIAELGNENRSNLFSIIKQLLGSDMQVKMTDPENEMSDKYIAVDNYNMSYTSAGFRLITSILTSLLDKDYENFLIDEPELGISPEIQAKLADFLLNEKQRKKYFPHLKKLFIATHSPVFIDKNNISNNYYIERSKYKIKISSINTVQEISSLQFFLLGNRFETLFLPSLIILVEGKSDFKYISQLVKKLFGKYNISIIQSNGDSRIGEYINIAKNMFGDLEKSPYHNRIIAVLDKVHQHGLKNKLIQQGICEKNIIVWDQNGIEHYYPLQIMYKIFGKYTNLKIEEDLISANGIKRKKNDLAEEVAQLITGKEKFSPEFNLKFMDLLKGLIY
jgi:predicted ATP-dependent endonuclease of OLD family